MPPKSGSNDFASQLQKGIQEINANIDKKLEEQSEAFEDRVSRALKEFEVKFRKLVSKIREDFAAETNKIKSDVNHCYEFIKQIDKGTTNKLMELERSHNVLMRRLNRPDIIVTGLPKASSNITTSILNIAKIYGVPLTENGINQIISIKNKNEVLVKFNSIATRDAIMKKYYATRSLKLNEVIGKQQEEINQEGVEEQQERTPQQDGTDIEERIFLNDHLTPMASKLCFICRKLKREKRIKEFKFHNGDVPRAVLKGNDGIDKTLDIFNLMEKYQEFCNSS